MTERKASMGDKVYRGDVVKFIRNNISLGTFMKRTVKTADEACWDLCDKLNYVPAIEESNEPHWIPVTEPPKGDFMPYYATCRSKVDDRENWVIEGMYTKYSGWEYPPMVRDDRAEIIAWMPKELPEPFKGVTE